MAIVHGLLEAKAVLQPKARHDAEHPWSHWHS